MREADDGRPIRQQSNKFKWKAVAKREPQRRKSQELMRITALAKIDRYLIGALRGRVSRFPIRLLAHDS